MQASGRCQLTQRRGVGYFAQREGARRGGNPRKPPFGGSKEKVTKRLQTFSCARSTIFRPAPLWGRKASNGAGSQLFGRRRALPGQSDFAPYITSVFPKMEKCGAVFSAEENKNAGFGPRKRAKSAGFRRRTPLSGVGLTYMCAVIRCSAFGTEGSVPKEGMGRHVPCEAGCAFWCGDGGRIWNPPLRARLITHRASAPDAS